MHDTRRVTFVVEHVHPYPTGTLAYGPGGQVLWLDWATAKAGDRVEYDVRGDGTILRKVVLRQG